MSQYLSIKLKHKNNVNNNMEIELLTLCTTPARQISGLGAFPYTEEDIPLDKETLSEYIDIIKEEIKEYEQTLKESETRLNEYKEYITNAKTSEVFETLRESIEGTKRYNNTVKEDIKEWQYYLDSFIFIKNIYETNKNDWELYYFNC